MFPWNLENQYLYCATVISVWEQNIKCKGRIWKMVMNFGTVYGGWKNVETAVKHSVRACVCVVCLCVCVSEISFSNSYCDLWVEKLLFLNGFSSGASIAARGFDPGTRRRRGGRISSDARHFLWIGRIASNWRRRRIGMERDGQVRINCRQYWGRIQLVQNRVRSCWILVRLCLSLCVFMNTLKTVCLWFQCSHLVQNLG